MKRHMQKERAWKITAHLEGNVRFGGSDFVPPPNSLREVTSIEVLSDVAFTVLLGVQGVLTVTESLLKSKACQTAVKPVWDHVCIYIVCFFSAKLDDLPHDRVI